MQAEWRDALANLFGDAAPTPSPVPELSLAVARGGTVAVHCWLTGLQPGQALSLDLRAGGRPVAAAQWFRLVAVPVEQNTGKVGFTAGPPKPGVALAEAPNPFVVRLAPFTTFDAMAPLAPTWRPDDTRAAVRLQVPVGLSSPPGERLYELTIRHAGVAQVLRLRVWVALARLPATGAATLPYTNWFSFDNIATRHGLQLWSPAYWRMLARYAELMVHARQNAFWLPLGVIFSQTADGPVLNRPRLRRLVALFTRAGMHFIEGGHLAQRTGGKWEATTFDTALSKLVATTPEGHAVLASLCRQLHTEILANGWQDRWLQHVTDEPTPANATEYRILVGMVHKAMPGIPIIDATQDPKLVGSVDIWCPQVQEYQHDRAAYEAQRALGDRVWTYTCCFPGGPWLNRLLDQELLRPTLLGWASALYRLDGFLHWGFNHYRADQDPFKMSVVPNWGGASNALPPGDTHIAYPGTHGPWSSLRLEAQREGLEDFELLRRLQTSQPAKAAAILATVIQSYDHYTKDLTVFRQARRALLDALDQGS